MRVGMSVHASRYFSIRAHEDLLITAPDDSSLPHICTEVMNMNCLQMKPVPVHMVRFLLLLLLLWLNTPRVKIYTYMKERHHIFH